MTRFKRTLTDTVAFTLTTGLTAELTAWTFGYATNEDIFTTWAPVYALATVCVFVLCGLVAHYSGRVTTIGRKLFVPAAPGRFWIWHLGVIFGMMLFLSWRTTQVSLGELFDARGIAGAGRLWSGLTRPNFELLPKAIAQAAETVLLAFLATILAVVPSFVLAFLAAQNLVRGPAGQGVYVGLRFALNVVRSVEPLIWALIFTVWVGVGPFAGMLALLIHSVASLTKYYSEIIEEVDDGPLDAIRSTGATPFQVVWYAVVPQVILPYIGMTVYRWDTNVRMATVIGLVGGGGIGTLLIQYQGQAMWPEVGCIVMVIAVIVWLLDFASAQIRGALK